MSVRTSRSDADRALNTARTGALAWNWKERSCGSWLDCDYHPDKRTFMSRNVDYYFSMHSPWAYIGHVPFMDVVRRHDAKVTYKPISLSDVFAKTGGLPITKRHPARLHYRMLELQRWREKRGLKFNLHPKYWPFNAETADRLVVAVAARDMIPIRFCAVPSPRSGRASKTSQMMRR